MGRVPGYLMTHEVEVALFRGHNATGPVHGPSATLPAFVDDRRRVIRTPDGSTITSGATVYLQLDAEDELGGEITSEAEVRVRDRPARVVDVRRRDGGGLPTPDHIEIVLE